MYLLLPDGVLVRSITLNLEGLEVTQATAGVYGEHAPYCDRCPEAVLEEVEPPSLTFTVPTGASALSRLFGQLAEAQAGLHVSECSVTQCTLEQIFLLMASKSSLRKNAANEEQLA